MHGMLSSAMVLAAFAVAAGAGGYTAVWLYRAAPGAPARSRPGLGDAEALEDTGVLEEPEETGAGELDAAEPGEPAHPDDSPGARVYVLREPPV